jgi:hypothetical protein
MPVSIEQMVARWTALDARPLFKGMLIDDAGCCCAQGDVLRVCGWSDERLHHTEQYDADVTVAGELGISITHSVLLRQVNDKVDGCPEDVLIHPERIIGDQAPRVLAFWRWVDQMDAAAGAAVGAAAWDAGGDAAWAAARTAAWAAAGDAAGDAARDTARAAAWAAAGAAASATNEIQGARYLKKFFFLPMFGISDPAELDENARAGTPLTIEECELEMGRCGHTASARPFPIRTAT